MFKKLILASSILAATTGIAVADSMPAPYVGAGLGIVTNTSNVKANGQTYTGGGYRGVPVNVFAGYGGLVNPTVYLAGELFSTVATANISDNSGLKSSYTYGAAFIPGVMLSDHTMAYGRVGVLKGHFTKADQTPTGGQFGGGLQTSLTQNVDLRGEYDFVAYNSIKSQGLSVSPRSDEFTVSLLYKFD